MSAVKTYLAGGFFVAAVASVPGFFIPAAHDVTPIEIHELTANVGAGTVVQVRTVHDVDLPGDVPMSWAARVVETASGATVYPCSGSGNYPYPQGRVEAEVPLDVWVGHAGCSYAILRQGVEYQLRATWWADGMLPVTASSEPFTVRGRP